MHEQKYNKCFNDNPKTNMAFHQRGHSIISSSDTAFGIKSLFYHTNKNFYTAHKNVAL